MMKQILQTFGPIHTLSESPEVASKKSPAFQPPQAVRASQKTMMSQRVRQTARKYACIQRGTSLLSPCAGASDMAATMVPAPEMGSQGVQVR